MAYKLILGIIVAILAAVSFNSNAALINRGGGLIYDTDLDITWLSDANYAQTSGYDADGKMIWTDSVNWAANLSYYDSVRDVTYTDWRLASTPSNYPATCNISNCTDSEMGHLYHIDLGGTGSSVLTTGDPDLTLFSNLQSSIYWSSTYFTNGNPNAWVFNFNLGQQFTLDKVAEYPCCTNEWYAWAVRDGDVGAVPVPAAAWLFSSGLLGLIGVAKRKKA